MNTRPKNHKASADALRRERDELREAVRVLAVAVRHAWYSTDVVRQSNAFSEAFNNPIAREAVEGA